VRAMGPPFKAGGFINPVLVDKSPLRQDRFVDAKAPAIVGPVDGSTSR
jgi:hypothetical protein